MVQAAAPATQPLPAVGPERYQIANATRGEYKIRVAIGEKSYDAIVWVNTGVESLASVHPERVK